MAWTIGILVLALVLTALTLAELRQPVQTNALKLPELTFGDRIIAVFVGVTFSVAFVNGLILLAAKTLP
jgi:hypothetical protein